MRNGWDIIFARIWVCTYTRSHARISGVYECGIVCETEIVEKQQKQL